ncbi:MAG: hypothetical protein SLAVMIC_00417 [uncultured marine phage]|uniref:Uncharacterized protein n=1 Tax=uncultured marine phage TaxID=707152 RepID=A0A8D9FQR9_9VIRU|nr:MAG: hypothetical protein SLAVMIC_00417 [uncultured marine phage]
MKYIKTFENYMDKLPAMSPEEYAEKWNPDYKFIVYYNGKPTSGWEFLYDAFRDGIAESHLELMSDEMWDFDEYLDGALSINGISSEDDVYDVDEEELNDCIKELLTNYDFDGTLEIRLVDSDEENTHTRGFTGPTKMYEELDKQTYLDAADKLDNISHTKRASKVRKHAHSFVDDQPYFNLGDGVQYINNQPRFRSEMRFIKCENNANQNVISRFMNKPIGVETLITFIFEDDEKDEFYLRVAKKKKEDMFRIYDFGSPSEKRARRGLCFYDRSEALKFIDFINQDEGCINELGDSLSLIKVNSVYLPSNLKVKSDEESDETS